MTRATCNTPKGYGRNPEPCSRKFPICRSLKPPKPLFVAARLESITWFDPGRQRNLAIAKFLCRPGSNQVIDSSRAATKSGFGGFKDLQIGNFREHGSGLRPYPLGVLQVARVMVRHFQAKGISRSARLQLCQHFRNVATLGREYSGSLAVFGIVAQQI